MQRLAICVDVGVLAPTIGLLAMLIAWEPPPTPEPPPLPICSLRAVAPAPAPLPLERYAGACRDLYDFRFPTHIGADGIPDEIVNRTFDQHGRVMTEDSVRDDAPHRIWTYRYDAAGRLARKATSVDNREVSITTHRYDRAGREIEQAIDENVDGKPDWLTLMTYDRRGRLATMRENVKAGSRRRGFGNWYHYDDRDRLVLHEQDNDGDGRANLGIKHTYDERGLLVEKRSHWYEKNGPYDEVFTYTYDAARRVTSETDRLGFVWIYRYDAAGNFIEKVRDVPAHLIDRTPLIRITYDYGCWQRTGTRN